MSGSDALQVGDYTAGNAHDVIRVRTEVVVPGSCRCPRLVVLKQIWVDEHAQLLRVTEGRNAAVGFGNVNNC